MACRKDAMGAWASNHSELCRTLSEPSTSAAIKN